MHNDREKLMPDLNEGLEKTMNEKKPVFIGPDGLIYDLEQAGQLVAQREDQPLTQLKSTIWMR